IGSPILVQIDRLDPLPTGVAARAVDGQRPQVGVMRSLRVLVLGRFGRSILVVGSATGGESEQGEPGRATKTSVREARAGRRPHTRPATRALQALWTREHRGTLGLLRPIGKRRRTVVG